ncbi:MAG TPA: D-aminoacyl-tRNA deacylase [Thermoclostridium caenicola]|uniref:D-aminoacyl-tRNA deacylase n=1 Tax=Thermoclostridium caenicola TaxID=659425 RepID=UPI002C9FE2D2|nr:D-aminoacyl-tRNA deacylase [Thermoclostridium caenicola]HOK43526.1 D-aminoacyl-tRNA deacylase [Thermoclostridium caenicola]HOL85197.1 D-aminoacyl-tRNA deacylase [Thermoclostridium caenicola]HPO77543.1 D-aminoacyl-tRNA deacylase [Thermoclostridium caenicola]
MRAVVQRVSRAEVRVDQKTVGKIGKGILVLLGIGQDDGDQDLQWLADKVMNLRIFEDENDKMNLSVLDVGGQVLVVSQFTLYGDCRKGKRPSYSSAAAPQDAEKLYEAFVKFIEEKYGIKVETGIFQAMMEVELVNDGPVTLLLDSKKTF